ncbi:xylulose-5-phosphate phosphoketolase [Pisolithus marmoratus]|nr:xylulose-5-phosphate phosphoketolase [Pisolithus marmoratus]
MMVQYSKFAKMAFETNWRENVGSINYIETSTWARQEHNGFSPEPWLYQSTMAHCLRSRNYINLILDTEEADRHCIAGASVWKFAGVDEGVDSHVRPATVFVGVGTEVTFEVIAATALLRKQVPDLRVRVVNVTNLMILGPHGSHPYALSDDDFDTLLTVDRSIIVSFHGYHLDIKGLVFGRSRIERMAIGGYREEGTTTAPFDLSTYHLAAAAVRPGAPFNSKVSCLAHEVASYFMHCAAKDKVFIFAYGHDPEGMFNAPVFERKK